MAGLTVLILTRNEAAVIARAIRSVAWAEDILVVDSESADDTRAIAAELGARVVVQPWLGWLGQKRVGVEAAREDWILSLDADEIVTPRLAAAIRAALAADPDPRDGFVLDRQDEFLGELMPNMRRRAKRDAFVRLFNRRESGWDPAKIVHEEILCPGALHPLEGPLLHWRNYAIGPQLDTLNRNAALEAEMLRGRSRAALAFGMTVKPPLRFAWIYLRSGYWRHGLRGFAMAGLQSFAEFLRHAKAWEAGYVPPRPHPPADLMAAAASGPAADPAARTPESAPAVPAPIPLAPASLAPIPLATPGGPA